MAASHIKVRGAREHNLKNVDVDIPRDKFVVITGLSGSGKSTLAFDTIFAEGQRRYMESLSAYARQFLQQMNKPDVDQIDGLSPAISIEQKTVSKNPRSTVGTVTEIYDYLRLLYARVGTPHCYQCGQAIQGQTVPNMVDQILGLPEGTRIHVMAPVIRGRKGEYGKEFKEWAKSGFVRARVDGAVVELADAEKLDKKFKHDIDIFIDRLAVKEDIRTRLTDSVETALRLAEGLMKLEVLGANKEVAETQLFSEHFACVTCGISYPELEPRMFSFNNPHGACQECSGLGSMLHVDPELIIDPDLPLAEGAFIPWAGKNSKFGAQALTALSAHLAFDLTTPWKKLPQKTRDKLLHGDDSEKVEFSWRRGRRKFSYRKHWEGFVPRMERRHADSGSDYVREEIERFMNPQTCASCGGARLRLEARHVRVGGIAINELVAMSVRRASEWMLNLKLTKRENEIAVRILKEIGERLGFLKDIGLDYLTMDRGAATLSGGEGQRIRLATQVSSSLMGVLYILDEPSIGLHPRDHQRLLKTLKRMRDLGNTVLVVEHDADTILDCDYVVDLGPGAGVHGGEIVFAGAPKELLTHPTSLTGAYLSGRKEIEIPATRRTPTERTLTVKGARGNNLKNLDVTFPLGCLTLVTGVSGSGKSTLLIDTLTKAISKKFYKSREVAAEHDSIEGLKWIDKLIEIDQSPIGRTPRSNPATYTGLFTHIRDLFAQLPEARSRGYAPGRFSFNVKGGRCEACSGDGLVKIEMHFLPDIYVECEECHGRRYNRPTLEVLYKGKSISDVLNMPVEEAVSFFERIPTIHRRLQLLQDVGLAYVKIGQQATTLSGGEAQRIKLARELSKRETDRTLYILDEPTTGLHFADVHKLIEVLQRLVSTGNTVIVIEHNLDMVKIADWVIDMGPEGGDAGGQIVAQGRPEDIAKISASHTGRHLAPLLDGRGARGATRARA